MSSDRIVLLGTGTCQLQDERKASSVLVEIGDLRLVYDFGRGIADRVASLGLRQDDVRHVVLSHFHPDHVSDLVPWLQAASWSRIDPRAEDLHVWGPRGLEVQMHRLLGLFDVDNLVPAGPRGSGSGSGDDRPWRLHVHEERGDRLEIDGRTFAFVDLPPAGNRGLRFTAHGKTVALTGDSFFHDPAIDFLRDVDLGVFDSGHLEDDEIVELAARSNARLLVASHVYRELDIDDLQARARERGFTGRLVVGYDGQVFP